MAKSKQNAIPLGQAWQAYWSILFDGGKDWKSDLEQLMLRRVVLLEFGTPTLGTASIQMDFPDWARDLHISTTDAVVSMQHGDLQPLSCPLFFEGMTEENPRWKSKHPIDGLPELDQRKAWVQKLWTDDCRKILNRATIGVGISIRNAVHTAIQTGMLGALGRPSLSPFEKLKPIPQEVFASPFELNFIHNTIVFGEGSAISSISLCPVVDKTRSNSFENADLILVEKMRQLVENEGESVIGAARELLHKAERRGDSSDGSVLRRLQNRYKRERSNYIQKKKPN